ncbi:MAG: hypothetical protein IJB68_07300 [Ruminococcus sp.]|nr:hypothetical protein [Ruminococcus sp.]
MDEIIITAAVVLAVIAIIEIVTHFLAINSTSSPPYVTVLPVFSDDELFVMRLEFLMRKGSGRQRVILVDYTADNQQKELCSAFIHTNPDASFIHYTEMKNFFAEIFAFHEKI